MLRYWGIPQFDLISISVGGCVPTLARWPLGGVCRQALTTGERCERIERSASVVTKELKSLVLKVEFEESLRNWLFLCCHYLCRLTLTHLESMAGTTGLEPATSAVTECKYYKNHRVTGETPILLETISHLKSVWAKKLYLGLYLSLVVCDPALPALLNPDVRHS